MDIFSLIDTVRMIAGKGLTNSRSNYDCERYEQLLKLTSEQYEEEAGMSADYCRNRFEQELGHITVKVGANSAIFNPNGEILLMDRADGSGWCLPGGGVELAENPAEAAVRETREETGLDVEVKQLVGVFTQPASLDNGPFAVIAVVHWCEVVGGELTLSHEGLGLRYWASDAVPNWHATHERYARAANEMRRNEGISAWSD